MSSFPEPNPNLLNAAKLRWCLHQFLDDSAFANRGGRIVYLVDANVVRFFASPEDDKNLIEVFGPDTMGGLAEGTALVTAEYVFSRQLPGQCDSPALIAPTHGDDLQEIIDALEAQSQRPPEPMPADVSMDALREVVDQLLASNYLRNERIARLRQIVPPLAHHVATIGYHESAQLLRLYNTDLMRPLRVHPRATRDILFLGSDDFRETTRWIGALRKERGRRKARRGADELIKRDAEALVQVMRLDAAAQSEGSEVRYAMITADRTLLDTYARWYWGPNRSLGESRPRFVLRDLLQYATLLNVRDLQCGIVKSDVMEAAQLALDGLLANVPHLREDYPQKLVYHRLRPSADASAAPSALETYVLSESAARALDDARKIWVDGFRNSVVLNAELIQRRLHQEFEPLARLLREKRDILASLYEQQRQTVGALFAAHATVTTRTNLRHLIGADVSKRVERHVPLVLRHDFRTILDHQPLERVLHRLAEGEEALAHTLEERLARAERDESVFFSACVAYRCNRWRAANLYTDWVLNNRDEGDTDRLDLQYLRCATGRADLSTVEGAGRTLSLCEDMVRRCRETSDSFGLCRALGELVSLMLSAVLRARLNVGKDCHAIRDDLLTANTIDLVRAANEALDLAAMLRPRSPELGRQAEMNLLRLAMSAHFFRGSDQWNPDVARIDERLRQEWPALSVPVDVASKAERAALGSRLKLLDDSQARATICSRVRLDTLCALDRAMLQSLQLDFGCQRSSRKQPMPDRATSFSEIEGDFHRKFGKWPSWIARAPGRVNLIGEHTDYNDGYVLPMALERDTIILAAPNDSNTMNLTSTALNQRVVSIDLTPPIEKDTRGQWSNYPRGVVAGFLKSGRGVPGFDALVHSTVPIGGGVSSSAALEVATATLLEAMLGEPLDAIVKAELCQKAEHDYAGVPCGLMDQFIATVGQKDHLLLLDCRSKEAEHIRFADPSISVLIINSNIKHKLARGEYGVRHGQCQAAAKHFNVPALRDVTEEQLADARDALDAVIYRRAKHVVGEIERTKQMAQRVRARDWVNAGQLMYASHHSLQMDFEVSCAELDTIVEIAQDIGVGGGMYGCRMTGGGFGGCAVALIEASAEAKITKTLMGKYLAETGRTPTIFSSRPGAGASLLRSGDIDSDYVPVTPSAT